MSSTSKLDITPNDLLYCSGQNCAASRRPCVEITRKEIAPGIVALELKGQLQSGVESIRLGQAMDELLREKQTRVILDLSKTTKVDSAGLGKIVNCLSRLKTSGGILYLAGVSEMVAGLLKMTKVDRLVKVYPTAVEAAQNFPDQQQPYPG
jgi:anti-sigma B factor antagonist